MDCTNTWISFYVWLEKTKQQMILMIDESTSSQHSWIALYGLNIETPTTFPPYKGIMLGERQNSSKAILLVLKDDSASGIDGRIHKNFEQLNWTNTIVKGLEMNMAISKEVKERFDIVQVSLNSVNNSLNNISKFYFSN